MSDFQTALALLNSSVVEMSKAQTKAGFNMVAAGVYASLVGLHHPIEAERVSSKDVIGSIDEVIVKTYADSEGALTKRGKVYRQTMRQTYLRLAKQGASVINTYFKGDAATGRAAIIAFIKVDLGCATMDALEREVNGRASSGNATKQTPEMAFAGAIKKAKAEGLSCVSEATAREAMAYLLQSYPAMLDEAIAARAAFEAAQASETVDAMDAEFEEVDEAPLLLANG
jgi:hypothetical protein